METKTFEIRELADTFREALLALIPTAERSGLNWTDDNPSDSWEQLAEACFDAFVRSCIVEDLGASRDDLPLPKYDFDYEDYRPFSWIGLSDEVGSWALVRILNGRAPFDTAQLVRVDLETFAAREWRRMPLAEAELHLVRRKASGESEFLTRVEFEQ